MSPTEQLALGRLANIPPNDFAQKGTVGTAGGVAVRRKPSAAPLSSDLSDATAFGFVPPTSRQPTFSGSTHDVRWHYRGDGGDHGRARSSAMAE